MTACSQNVCVPTRYPASMYNIYGAGDLYYVLLGRSWCITILYYIQPTKAFRYVVSHCSGVPNRWRPETEIFKFCDINTEKKIKRKITIMNTHWKRIIILVYFNIYASLAWIIQNFVSRQYMLPCTYTPTIL